MPKGYPCTLIPRDAELLHRLYWVEDKSLRDMAAMFGCKDHSSVSNVMRKLGVKLMSKGRKRPLKFCIDCKVAKPRRLPHKLTKNGTGTRCHECLKKYKRQWLKKALKRRPDEVRARRKKWMQRWYEIGPVNPKGEAQWIRKAKHLLRTNRRLLKAISREASPCLTEASATAMTSRP